MLLIHSPTHILNQKITNFYKFILLFCKFFTDIKKYAVYHSSVNIDILYSY